MSLALPAANDVAGNGQQVVGGYESGRGNGGGLVDNGRLDVALNGLDGGSVDDATQSTDGVGTVYDVASDSSVLHDTAGDHDDVLGGVGELLDDQVDHLAEGSIFVLEQLGNAEEERGCFILRELFASEEQEGDLCEEDTAFARRDGRCVEDTSYRGLVSDSSDGCVLGVVGIRTLLEDRGTVDLEQAGLVLVLLVVTHGWSSIARRV